MVLGIQLNFYFKNAGFVAKLYVKGVLECLCTCVRTYVRTYVRTTGLLQHQQLIDKLTEADQRLHKVKYPNKIDKKCRILWMRVRVKLGFLLKTLLKPWSLAYF
jgi:hypothetical protein